MTDSFTRAEYTLSIAMTRAGKVVWVRKEHGPMAGTLIFPGGKVEEGEDPFLANCREFEEELGVKTEVSDWFPLATINYPGYTLHVCLLTGKTIRDSLTPEHTDTGEEIFLVNHEDYSPDEHNFDGLCKSLLDEVVYKMM